MRGEAANGDPKVGARTTRTKTTYRIVVGGELSDRYASAFEGMEMEAANGQTTLTGEVVDQPQLHGILDRINSLGLRLMSVEPLPQESQTGGRKDRRK
jgi:hypothetical protein